MFPNGFRTSRLTLRPIATGDAGPIFDTYAQDPQVTRFLTWRPHARPPETEAYVLSCQQSATSRTYVLIQNGALIGVFDLRQERAHALGFGYALARAVWGQGLMTEALTEVSRWALVQPAI